MGFFFFIIQSSQEAVSDGYRSRYTFIPVGVMCHLDTIQPQWEHEQQEKMGGGGSRKNPITHWMNRATDAFYAFFHTNTEVLQRFTWQRIFEQWLMQLYSSIMTALRIISHVLAFYSWIGGRAPVDAGSPQSLLISIGATVIYDMFVKYASSTIKNCSFWPDIGQIISISKANINCVLTV